MAWKYNQKNKIDDEWKLAYVRYNVHIDKNKIYVTLLTIFLSYFIFISKSKTNRV